MDEMVQITDIEGNIIYVNSAIMKHTQFSKEELLGKNNRIFKSGSHSKDFYKELWDTILSGKIYQNILINKKKDGSLYYDEKVISPLKDENNDICCFISTGRDITDRIALEEELNKLATKDMMTGIYNRYKINSIIEDEIKRAKRYGEIFSLIMFDIDYFKKVNDTYGHDIGDYVLQELSRIILQSIRQTDSFGRWGGEEFMLVVPYTNKQEAIELAQKIRNEVQNHSFEYVKQITLSIGVTQYLDNEEKDTLIKRVDSALYKAKANGRNQVVFF